jgi:hypothetical protein
MEEAMNKFRNRYLAVTLGVAAIAAAGCGSSSSSKSAAKPAAPATPSTPATGTTGTGTTAAPKSGFSAQLEALCKQSTQVAQSAGTNLPAVGAKLEPFIAKFEALTPPAKDKANYEKLVASAKATVAAAKKNDQAAIAKAEAESKGLGAKLGAPGCDA